MKKPILTDGLFCVCSKPVAGADKRSASGRLSHHCRMAASPYPAYSQYKALWLTDTAVQDRRPLRAPLL
ncbi:TPA: hypothetical protein ACX13R_004520 [Citrobacter amalonaticus]